MSYKSLRDFLEKLEAEMLNAAEKLDFERAAQLRDEVLKLRGKKKNTQNTYGSKRRKR